MQTVITIDDALYSKALELTDPGMDKAVFFQEAVKKFVRIQATKRLVTLGGAAPDMQKVSRRRQEPSA